MPSPLFNILFIVALFVPTIMYVGGVSILMVSLIRKHYRATHETTPRSIEALAH